MSIKNILRISVAVALFFALAVIASLIIAAREIDDAVTRGHSADIIVAEVFHLSSLTDEYLANAGGRIIEQWKITHDNIEILLEAQGGSETREEQELVARLWENNTDIGAIFDEIIKNDSPSPALLERQSAQLKIRAQSMVSDAARLGALKFKGQENLRDFVVSWLILLTVFFLASIVGVIIFLYIRIKKPITELHHGTDRIAGGDLMYRLDIRNNDEFGQVAGSFNTMADRLGELYNDIEKKLQGAEETARSQKEFIAMLSHELRNPLAAVMTTVEVMRLENSNRGQVQTNLDIIYKQTFVMKKLVDDLLNISRIMQGKIELKKQLIDLRDVVEETLAISKDKAHKKNQALEYSGNPSPIKVYADPLRIAQIMTNLIDNAVKFTPEGGIIRVATNDNGESAFFSVADNGVGMREENIGKIFEPFIQIHSDSAAEETQSGIGLGLNISKALAELHGGSITARSAGIGKGSEFIVSLPLA